MQRKSDVQAVVEAVGDTKPGGNALKRGEGVATVASTGPAVHQRSDTLRWERRGASCP